MCRTTPTVLSDPKVMFAKLYQDSRHYYGCSVQNYGAKVHLSTALQDNLLK